MLTRGTLVSEGQVVIVKKILLENITSFYGKHALHLQDGINFIIGPGGSGKTNVARALEFAFLGYASVPRKKLFNFRHTRENLEKSQKPFCQVEVEIQHENRNYIIRSGLSMIGEKEITESLTIPPEIDSVITDKTFQHVYLSPLTLDSTEEDGTHSTATRITRSVINHLMLNLKAGIKMAILDGILEQLSHKYSEQLLGVISQIALEQTIIITSPQPMPYNLED